MATNLDLDPELIERALALTSGPELRSEDFPLGEEAAGGEPRRLEESLLDQAAERQLTLRELGDIYIDRVLELCGGNKVRAARVLGINRRTLYRRGEHSSQGCDSDHSFTHGTLVKTSKHEESFA